MTIRIMTKRTKIVCTIGPASESKDALLKMIKTGMNVCRLNFSHGTYKQHKELINNIQQISQELNLPIAIMADLQGPRIRTGQLPEAGIKIKKDQIIILNAHDHQAGKLSVTYKKLAHDLNSNDRILIDDGLIELKVKKIYQEDIFCQVVRGGTLKTHKGMNFPDTKLSIVPITEKDKKDLKFAIKNNVDFIALSFVYRAKDNYDLKYLIK